MPPCPARKSGWKRQSHPLRRSHCWDRTAARLRACHCQSAADDPPSTDGCPRSCSGSRVSCASAGERGTRIRATRTVLCAHATQRQSAQSDMPRPATHAQAVDGPPVHAHHAPFEGRVAAVRIVGTQHWLGEGHVARRCRQWRGLLSPGGVGGGVAQVHAPVHWDRSFHRQLPACWRRAIGGSARGG